MQSALYILPQRCEPYSHSQSNPSAHPLTSHSNSSMHVGYAVIVCGLVAVVYLLRVFSRPAFGKDFPGPPRVPVIGNILPSGRVWMKLAELGRTYGMLLIPALEARYSSPLNSAGPIYSLRIFGSTMLVVNDADAARELFELRSARYANRPLTTMVKMSVVYH